MSFRNRIRWAALFAALTVANVGAVRAALLDSNSFNHKYEGDVYNNPGIPNYAEEVETGNTPNTFSLVTAVAGTTDGNVLQTQSDVPHYADLYSNSSAGEWVNGPNPAANSTGWTIEFSVKIGTDATEGTDGAFLVFSKEQNPSGTLSNSANNATRRAVIAIGQSKAVKQEATITSMSTADNTDAFHVFRIAEAANSSNITVWRDGAQIYTGVSASGNNATAAQVYFGDPSGGIGGPTVQLDYFRWDSTGPYEPVPAPEPGSVVLMSFAGVGGMMLSRRRR